MKISVIIPTFNAAGTLPLVLPALCQQQLLSGWEMEVIISDDGSSDATLESAKNILIASRCAYQIVVHPHRGAAAARNHGIEVARGDIIFLLGADIILLPGALAAHARLHIDQPAPQVAALGMVKWDPRLPASAYMEWMAHGGPQNDFDALLGVRWADPARFFYGSHISFKRSFLGKMRFNESFGPYGWEDLEMGRRLATQELQLGVLHNAVGLHHHRSSFRELRHRQFLVGAGLVQYQRAYPMDVLIPRASRWSRVRRWAFLRLGGRQIVRYCLPMCSAPWYFSLVTRAEFWAGVQKMS